MEVSDNLIFLNIFSRSFWVFLETQIKCFDSRLAQAILALWLIMVFMACHLGNKKGVRSWIVQIVLVDLIGGWVQSEAWKTSQLPINFSIGKMCSLFQNISKNFGGYLKWYILTFLYSSSILLRKVGNGQRNEEKNILYWLTESVSRRFLIRFWV